MAHADDDAVNNPSDNPTLTDVLAARVTRRSLIGGGQRIQAPSKYARRITAYTPCAITGPARGHALMKTVLDPAGNTVLGTINNCANGYTPWGTYLTCEENFNGYFVHSGDPAANDKTSQLGRYGISARSETRWPEHDPRFDATQHPNESNRFGWVVEIDPRDPRSSPAKRTALGRLKHEGATVTEATNGRVVVYMGDDQAHEYIYKFVGSEPWRVLQAQRKDPLDHGTLYVAKFANGDTAGDAKGGGQWVALSAGAPGLESFASQAEILINARTAADRLGATKMDRPEWIAVHPETGEVYCTLTNNSSRTVLDDANPRKANAYGQIIRWREAGGDAAASTFEWDLFVLAGDPTKPAPVGEPQTTVADEDRFGSPDGLWFDDDGRLWIQTDVSASNLSRAAYERMRNHQMLAADPTTGEIRRFLIGPINCEITGITATPDGRTLFVGIQHPGESPTDVSDPTNPTQFSTWPDGPDKAGRPRSSVLVITKDDGGVVGRSGAGRWLSALGMLATELGRYDDADGHFRHAVEIQERIGRPPALVHTRLEWARMLLRRGGPGDADQARGLLEAALPHARELGLSGVEPDIEALLAELA